MMKLAELAKTPEFWPASLVVWLILLCFIGFKFVKAWQKHWAQNLPNELKASQEKIAQQDKEIRRLEQAVTAGDMEIERLREKLRRAEHMDRVHTIMRGARA